MIRDLSRLLGSAVWRFHAIKGYPTWLHLWCNVGNNLKNSYIAICRPMTMLSVGWLCTHDLRCPIKRIQTLNVCTHRMKIKYHSLLCE